jgi:D-3-phosphoglycerate dehydrogenase
MESSTKRLVHLGRRTKGDDDFYYRWAKEGFTVDMDLHEKVKYLVVDQYTKMPDISQLHHLEYIISPTTGHTHLQNIPEYIKLITLRGEIDFLETITSVAEHTIHLILKLAKERDVPFKVAKGLIGIVGMGRVGKQVCTMVKGLRMDVRGYDKGLPLGHLEDIFKTSDMVTIHLSENSTTKGLIDRKLIWSMKPGAVLINTSRASICDNKAIYDACKMRRISAACDVWDYWQGHALDNLLITPHIGGRSLGDRIATDEFIIKKTLVASNPGATWDNHQQIV